MNRIVNELLLRMEAGLYLTLDAEGQLVVQHRGSLKPIVGCAVLLQHHLCEANGPTPPPEKIDEPVFDEAKPECNLELASTESLVRVLYQQKKPWALGILKMPKTGSLGINFGTWWQGDPYICMGLASAGSYRFTHHLLDLKDADPMTITRYIAFNIREVHPGMVWAAGLARVLETRALMETRKIGDD